MTDVAYSLDQPVIQVVVVVFKLMFLALSLHSLLYTTRGEFVRTGDDTLKRGNVTLRKGSF